MDRQTLYTAPGICDLVVPAINMIGPVDLGNDYKISETLVITLVSGTSWDNQLLYPADTMPALLQLLDHVAKMKTVPLKHGLAQYSKDDSRWVATNYYWAMSSHCLNRRLFFASSSSTFGLGLLEMQVGDIVAIIFGCGAPVVLRPLVIGKSEYSFVGCCFIDGIMYGEATRQHKAMGKEDVIFYIK